MKFISALPRLSALLLLMLFSETAVAQSFQTIRIASDESPRRQVNIENGPVALSAAGDGWLSARWAVEPIAGTNRVYLRNIWKGNYLFATRFYQDKTFLNVTSVDLQGKTPETFKVNNLPEFQWFLDYNPTLNKYYVKNAGAPEGQLHAETVNGVATLFVNVGSETAGPIVNGTLMWNLEQYTPPPIKRVSIGGGTIDNWAKIKLGTGGAVLDWGTIDNIGNAVVGFLPGQTALGKAALDSQAIYKVEIVDEATHTIKLQATGRGIDGMYLTRVSYWSGLPDYKDFSFDTAQAQNPTGAYQTFTMTDAAGGGVYLAEQGAYLDRFCCVPPAQMIGPGENIIVSKFSDPTAKKGVFNVTVVNPW